MKKVITTEKKPIKMWLDDIDDGALEQAKNLANLPFTFKHVAIMPDSHKGCGMPIGSVLATDGVVIPNAVGQDIGCGVLAVRTSLTEISRDNLSSIVDRIRKKIPMGFSSHENNANDWLADFHKSELPKWSIVYKEYENSLKQLGTLGGGNHFIEIQQDSNGFIWIMIHSGSRRLGNKVATYYDKKAIELNKKWFSYIEKDLQLAFLPIKSEYGKKYITDMRYCNDYARENRMEMYFNVLGCIYDVVGKTTANEFMDTPHNNVAMENHFNQNVMVHRKGSIMVNSNNMAAIPGSQGTSSYIVTGKNNKDSFYSCSHGAGRKLGRNAAKRTLDLETELDMLNKAGVLHNVKTVDDLDEAPSSYKDIDTVMENQSDLVDIVMKLKPLAAMKG